MHLHTFIRRLSWSGLSRCTVMANSFLVSEIITAIHKVITQHGSQQQHAGIDDMVRASQAGRTYYSTAETRCS